MTGRPSAAKWLAPISALALIVALFPTTTAWAGAKTSPAAQTTTCTPSGAIRTLALGQTLAVGDDNSSVAINLGFTLNFFGTNYTQLFVNNNGNVTFGSALGTFTSSGMSGVNYVTLAPFFADVDTRGAGGGTVRYDQVADIGGHPAFAVYWNNVGYFGSHTDKLNNFQVVIINRDDRAAGDFDFEFNYSQVQWETGDASGGSGGLGGTSATVGYADGLPGTNDWEVAGSRVNGAFLDTNASTGLIHTELNSGICGRYAVAVHLGSPPDLTAPTVTSIVRAGASPTNAASVDFTVTFSESVTNVDTADFTLTTTGSVSGASVTSVSAGPSATYTVSVNTGSGSGTIRLDLTAGATVEDLSANDFVGPYTGGQAYTIERTAPSILSIVRADPSPTNAASVDFIVTFDEVVTDVTPVDSDFVLTTTGLTGASITGFTASPSATYTVTVDTGTGSGTIRLDLDAGASIFDLAGNAFVGPYTGGETYTIDRTNSAVTSILRHAPLTSPTNATSVTFRVTFSEDVQNVDSSDFGLALGGTVTGTVNAVVVQGASVYDVTITGVSGDGSLGLVFQATNNIQDLGGNPLGSSPTIGTTENYTIDNTGITVLAAGVVGFPGAVTILDGGSYTTHFTSFEVRYDSDANNPGGSSDPEDVTNPLNYILIEDGPDGVPGMTACVNLDTDDVFIATGPVTYDNGGGAGPYVATITVNGGTPLPSGTYRLFICSFGATIVDLAGNPLNGGVDEIRDFTIFNPSGLPATGFAPGQATILPEQPSGLAYTAAALQLVIPRLSVRINIVGVPEVKDEWDVTWLGSEAGWLQGTAFPGWDGNSVLTGHAYGYDGKPGPFASLDRLAYGDRIVIAAWNQVYTYEVREVTQVSARAVSTVLKHEEKPWLTLLTCRGYDSSDGSYRSRVVVRAVQIKIDDVR